ncbi:radical SAM protein [Methylosinus sp. Sm6]|uniref:radical SAM protein n=1 Tax=Methylosinus sp. Sm6 TaxID=2866948 RepID=UPI001C99527B|nr:radical SAM protein [Methylosinus sp. Sm6]MBY6244073.1 radical SAM protein [Methylosinus sp. Sm6]
MQFDACGMAAPSADPSRAHSASANFCDPYVTARGERRAHAPFVRLETLWFNTGTLCNLGCRDCYIESSPRNDSLAYFTREDARAFLEEAKKIAEGPLEIGFTGGEPFMNPDLLGMMEDSLAAGHRVLVLTNAMRPMQRVAPALCELNMRFPGRLACRVSLDHYRAEDHEKIRGPNSWAPAIDGLLWLAANRFDLAVAARMASSDGEAETRAGFRDLFEALGVAIDADDPARLVLFPELAEDDDAPEISEGCWTVLGKSPEQMMCARSRMVLKRKGAETPTVVSCTLLPYAQAFEMGATLAEAMRPVSLNHVHCSRFCVLGGATCSATGAAR